MRSHSAFCQHHLGLPVFVGTWQMVMVMTPYWSQESLAKNMGTCSHLGQCGQCRGGKGLGGRTLRCLCAQGSEESLHRREGGGLGPRPGVGEERQEQRVPISCLLSGFQAFLTSLWELWCSLLLDVLLAPALLSVVRSERLPDLLPGMMGILQREELEKPHTWVGCGCLVSGPRSASRKPATPSSQIMGSHFWRRFLPAMEEPFGCPFLWVLG